jgi:hypothetical protein
MRDIAVISFAQTPGRRSVPELNEVEMLMPAILDPLKEDFVTELDSHNATTSHPPFHSKRL